MAAAEYYSGGPLTSHPAPPHYPQQPGPHPPAQQSSSLHPQQQSSGLPYPISDAPPPYTAYAEQRPHSQPPPQQRPPTQPGGPGPQPPPPTSHPHYPPEKSGYGSTPPIQNMYRPQDFNPNYHPQQQPPQPGFYPPQGPPAMQQVYGNSANHQRPSSSHVPGRRQDSYPGAGYSRSRSRSRSHSRHRKHRHDRPQLPRKKSSGVNTFLGAGGGAIIGDAIFPGLGTLGGAILGGFGGHEYGKRRSHSHPHRTRDRSYSNDGPYYESDYRRGRKY